MIIGSNFRQSKLRFYRRLKFLFLFTEINIEILHKNQLVLKIFRIIKLTFYKISKNSISFFRLSIFWKDFHFWFSSENQNYFKGFIYVMATCRLFARLAHYLLEFDKVSLIFLRVRQMSTILSNAILASIQ